MTVVEQRRVSGWRCATEARRARGARREALELVRLKRDRRALSARDLGRAASARRACARARDRARTVLLLDEPLSNLDAKLREEMRDEMRAIQQRLGITTIFVTHDQVEAMTMCDRIAVMHRGRIAQLSTPFEAYERPETPFASTFLGKTNTFAGEVLRRNPRCTEVDVAGTTLKVPATSTSGAARVAPQHFARERVGLAEERQRERCFRPLVDLRGRAELLDPAAAASPRCGRSAPAPRPGRG